MRKPTEAQKAAAAERRAKFRALVSQVAAMSEADRVALVERAGAVVTCEGRALSPRNTCLLFMQLPAVSMVGGFQQWRKAGRIVRKGEHGAMIWIPRMVGAHDAGEQVAQGQDAGGEDGGELRFLTATVFDISQTDALPADPVERIVAAQLEQIERVRQAVQS